ncbi:hypothetical protein HZS_2056 [Henneguya salminicola]|nr:hypothetical protein HZS_2056 [Henneguya salminicola]
MTVVYTLIVKVIFLTIIEHEGSFTFILVMSGVAVFAIIMFCNNLLDHIKNFIDPQRDNTTDTQNNINLTNTHENNNYIQEIYIDEMVQITLPSYEDSITELDYSEPPKYEDISAPSTVGNESTTAM